jgi:hypothetical protein
LIKAVFVAPLFTLDTGAGGVQERFHNFIKIVFSYKMQNNTETLHLLYKTGTKITKCIEFLKKWH